MDLPKLYISLMIIQPEKEVTGPHIVTKSKSPTAFIFTKQRTASGPKGSTPAYVTRAGYLTGVSALGLLIK